MLAVCPGPRHQQLAPSGYTGFSQNTKCAESCCCISEQGWRAPCASVLSCANNCSQSVCCACVPLCAVCEARTRICVYVQPFVNICCIPICVCVCKCVCLCVCHRQGFFLSFSTNKHHGCQTSSESHQTNPLWDRLTMWILRSKYTIPCLAAANSTTVNDLIWGTCSSFWIA